jgi:hypothetical protein
MQKTEHMFRGKVNAAMHTKIFANDPASLGCQRIERWVIIEVLGPGTGKALFRR